MADMTETAAAQQPCAAVKPLPARGEVITALCSYGIGVLYTYFLSDISSYYGPGKPFVVLFPLAYLLWVEYAARERERRLGHALTAPQRRECVLWGACILVLCAAQLYDRCSATDGYDMLLLHALAAYYVLCRTNCLTDGESGILLPLDGLAALVVLPFGGIFRRVITLVRALVGVFAEPRQKRQLKTQGRTALISAVFLLVMLPLLWQAGSLLGEADPDGFGRFWAGLRLPSLNDDGWEFLVHLLFGLPVGAYLNGLVSGCLCADKPVFDGAKLRSGSAALRLVPAACAAAVIGALLALYGVFFGFQGSYLFAAFAGSVPGSYTAAEFARSGFFQLCRVLGLQFVLLGAVCLFGRESLRSHKLLRPLTGVTLAAGLLLAVTAAARLGLYISRYGFTPLRLQAAWAIFVMGAACVLGGAALLRNCKAAKIWILLAGVSFSLLAPV